MRLAALVLAAPLLALGPADAGAEDQGDTRCDTGPSCAELAKRYRTGDGVPENIALAMAYWRTSCDLGEQGSCDALQGVLENGLGNSLRTLKRRPAARADRREVPPVDGREAVVARGLKRAATVFETRCRGDEGDSCYQLATMLEAGTGVRADLSRAAEAYERACRLGIRHGCLEGGRLVATGGRHLEREPRRALKLLARACDSDLAEGCLIAGRLVEADDSKARAFYQRGCDGGAPLACAGLTYLDARAAEADSPSDRSRALELYDTACRQGHAAACRDAAELHELIEP
jgi:TPR repeat protein